MIRRDALTAVLLLCLSSIGACAGGKTAASKERKPPPPQPTTVVPKFPDVDKLVTDQKLAEAVGKLDKIIVDAEKSHDEMRLVAALVRRTTLQVALGQFETSVAALRSVPRPKAVIPELALELYYAAALTDYLRQYGWEIGQREQVVHKGDPGTEVALKTLSKDEIYAEALRAYERVWARREEVGAWKVGALGSLLSPNDYPDNIRGELRDSISYLAAEQLADSGLWSAQQSNELFRVGVDSLLWPQKEVSLVGPAHPMQKLAFVLDDLERFHVENKQHEAALEARLSRLRFLHGAFTDKASRDQIEAALVSAVTSAHGLPWSATGDALRAEWLLERGERVQAHDVAKTCAATFPDTTGGRQCKHWLDTIEEPRFSVTGMKVDGLHHASIDVSSVSVAQLYFRAYAYDAVGRLPQAREYDAYPSEQALLPLLKQKPTVAWTTPLTQSHDWAEHATHVTPPLPKKGFYVILASPREDFRVKDNQIHGVEISVSDLVLVTRDVGHGAIDARVYDGPSGKLVDGADIETWRMDWQNGHHKIGSARTDRDGHAVLRPGRGEFFFVTHKGNDTAFAPEERYAYDAGTDTSHRGTLVYTDRSVYRPGQKLDWKVVVYDGKHAEGKFQVAANTNVLVRLLDANGQMVQSATVRTSAYGSASGEFTVPSGRALGQWHLDTSTNGAAYVRVEEYKRPTFEVKLEAPGKSLVLNEPAKLHGEARYYFGQPVTGGTARYVVTREPVYPFWWGWYHDLSAGGSQTVARGESHLGPDGTFDVEWKPEVATTEDHDVSYRYGISADVTDDGGETRSATRSYRLGFQTVEASLVESHGFLSPDRAGTLTLHRADLDGTPRAGAGTYRVVKLEQPAHTLLPSELPARTSSDPAHQSYPADLVRSRVTDDYQPRQVLAGWKDGAEVAHGALSAAADGSATLALPTLPGGAYRVRYETTDDRGNKATTFTDVLVAGDTVRLPALFELADGQVRVGDTARLLVETGLPDQTMVLETFRDGAIIDRKLLTSPHTVLDVPIKEADRGGLAFALTMVRDHQRITLQQQVTVPWDNQSLRLAFSTFRDTMRPGAKETFRVTVESDGKDPKRLAGGAELLAYMYDRSLDLFAPHNPPSAMSLFPLRSGLNTADDTLGASHGVTLASELLSPIEPLPLLTPDRLSWVSADGIGGLGLRGVGYGSGGGRNMLMSRAAPAPMMDEAKAERPTVPKPEPVAAIAGLTDKESGNGSDERHRAVTKAPGPPGKPADAAPRSNFAETAFWQPALVLDQKGETSFEFTVPDSVTSWNVWVHAITKDLRSGSIEKETRSVKDLMVRPYLPRFLREGDVADIEVVVNDAGKQKLDGTLSLAIEDPATHASRVADFQVKGTLSRPFSVEAGKSTHVTFSIVAPRKLDTYAFVVKATAKSGSETLSDGELRPLPILPSRLHLVQSRFVTLHDTDKRTMRFDDLAKSNDPTRVSEQLVVTLDAQLFFTVLRALPYLIEYPYECAEQTLNRFVSTGIVTSLYDQYPSIATMASQMSQRKTEIQPWDAGDANRKLALEETPFLAEARGDGGARDPLINVLDRRIAQANRDSALDKLRRMQTSAGGFPWFPGGPPSPFMTLYVLDGFSRAAEFKVDLPKDMVQRGWQYLARNYRDEYASKMMKDDCCWEFLTLLNYVAGAYPDESWTGNALTPADRQKILAFTFKHWKETSPRIKALLALTLKRMGRPADAKLVWDSVMDSAKTEEDKGTFWAPEDRSWLWYNDTIESEAFALRTLMEIDPQSPKRDGLVLWLLLNKKLNQWKSTRATAEVLYSLATYMKATQSLGVREAATVSVGTRSQTFAFEPDKYVGKVQMIVPGNEVTAKSADISIKKETKGTMFASATWSFATDELPKEGRGDFFDVKRAYYLRRNNGTGFELVPIADGATLKLGDEVEVQLAISSKHEAEYVHLRDPRGAGFEPVSQTSHWSYDLGLSYYEEVRDSGENFFFEALPAGQYTFKYRIRATTAGTFRVGPATLQSMYAPEFNAYSAGHVMKVGL